MRRAYSACCIISLVIVVSSLAGCGHKTETALPAAAPSPSAPPINIVGAWAGHIGPMPVTYVFNADGTESVITQQRDGTMSTKGTYTLAGNRLTIHTSSMQAMGQTASEDTTNTHTISVSGDQLTIQDMGLVLTRQANANAIPQASAETPTGTVQTMPNGQHYIQGPATVTIYPSGAPPASSPPAGPHTIAPPAPPSSSYTIPPPPSNTGH